MMRLTLNLFFWLFISILSVSASTTHIADIFGDNMVIQQGIHAPVWGISEPGSSVTIDFAGNSTTAITNSQGNWKVLMPILESGGPFEMIVSAKDTTIRFTNVMIGEVWLASGQSNMDWRISNGVTNPQEVYANANQTDVRFFNVEYNVSRIPVNNLPGGKWQVADSNSVKTSSAVAYYFARELAKDKNVAVGILNSSWGGTIIEAWTSGDILSTHPDFEKQMKEIEASDENWTSIFQQGFQIDKEREKLIQGSFVGIEQGVHERKYDDSEWNQAPYPIEMNDIGEPWWWGIAWFRKTVELPGKIVGDDLILNIGKLSDSDITYFNGQEIGRGFDHNKERIYTIPKKLIKAGKNVIAIRLVSKWGGHIGTESGNPHISFKSTDTNHDLSLKGNWFYNINIEPRFPEKNERHNYPSALFNAMINPLIPYGIKGIAWYQGASNSGRPFQYRSLFPKLLNDWRTRWQLGYIPCLVVQLTNSGSNVNRALMRETQYLSTKQPNTGLVVTFDIGEKENVHPHNKIDVGKRLYEAAKHYAYGENNVYSGPIYESMETEDNKLILSFNHIGSGLTTGSERTLYGFSIAGKDSVFVPAQAIIRDNQVVVWSDRISHPVAARYGWEFSADAICNLYNNEGLAASPFRTDDWKINP